MATEKEKMKAGELYDPLDAVLVADRIRTRQVLSKLNTADEADTALRKIILEQLIPNAGEGLWMQPPFYCDYGYHIYLGDKVFFNFNCVVLDVAPVTIGSRTLFGPNVQIYTAMHPTSHTERASGIEFARPITIGEDVWVGGSAVICPGVTLGDRCIIGAGSVVIKDIPPDTFAAGNPCRVIRTLLT